MHEVHPEMDPVELMMFLIVGHSGAGKTHSLQSLPGLWLFSHEPDGVPVVGHAASRTYLLEDNLGDYKGMKELLLADHGECGGRGCTSCRHTGAQCAADGCRAVAYESLTEAHRICLNHAREVNNKRRQKPLPEGAFDKLDYNLSYSYLISMLTFLRSVRVPVFVAAHADDPEPVVNLPDGSTARYVRWSIPGIAMDSKIPRYFTAVGGLHHRLGPPEERAVVFDPTVVWAGRMFRVKSVRGLDPVEPPEPGRWLEKISASLSGSASDQKPLALSDVAFLQSPPDVSELEAAPGEETDPAPAEPAYEIPE